MAESYYRSGQAAKQLGVSSYHIRRLCEVGEIAAELTDGQQWKIPRAGGVLSVHKKRDQTRQLAF